MQSGSEKKADIKNLKPFVKWAGGKTQLLFNIRNTYPRELGHTIFKYAEPFVGGGAVLFDILNQYDLKEIYISDTNAALINTYKGIQNHIEILIEALYNLQNEYLALEEEERSKFYYEKRKQFNSLKLDSAKSISIEKAVLFIFLNKTCFNGLYRVNKQGGFNVPAGRYKAPTICDEQNLRNIAKAIQNVKIVCAEYEKSLDFIDENTFVYCDPPYRPISDSANFRAYTENQFNDLEQIKLAEFIDKINAVGAKVLLSNSDPKNLNSEDNFFDDLYKNYSICRVEANRMINCNGKSRGKITELLICNFKEEKKEMAREFHTWLASFRNSISNYGYYTDFEKVYKNVDKIKIELNILNSLIGSNNIEQEFETIVSKYPQVLSCIPLLLAVRAGEIYAVDSDGAFTYSFQKMNYSIEQYKIFMKKTGLFDLLENHMINNLVDYMTGVEIGLDSNGRKNREGHLMENLVESYLIKAGFKKETSYFKEMYINEIQENWNIDLSALSNEGKMEKRFDFVVKTNSMIYGIETNFYSSSGSKLNETARSYKTLALEANTIEEFTFVWFTDGIGWRSAKNNLEETFDSMEHIYNIQDLEKGIISKVFK